MTFFGSNWRKSMVILQAAFAALTLLLAVVHIYVFPVGGLFAIVRFGLLISIGASALSLFKPQIFEKFFQSTATDNELFRLINQLKDLPNIDHDSIEKFKKHATAQKNFDWKQLGVESPLQRVVGLENPQLAIALFEAGVNPFERIFGGRATALEVAVLRGNKALAQAVARAMAKHPVEFRERNLISRALLAVVLEDDSVLKSLSKADLEKKDSFGWQPIHHAVMIHSSTSILKTLLDAGVNLNEPVVYPDDKKQLKIVLTQLAPLRVSQTKDEAPLISVLTSGRAKIAFDDKYPDAVLASITMGLTKTVKAMEGAYDWSTIFNGRTALDFAKDSKNLAMVELVTKNMQSAGLLQPNANVSGAPQNQASNQTKSKASSTSGGVVNRQLELSEVQMKVSMSLDGLVDMDSCGHDLAVQFTEFQNRKPKQSHGIVIWGDASVGKSSIGKRLAGLFDSQGVPGLELPELPFEYHSLADSTKSLPEIIENVPAGSIVFFDEIDKFFDPSSNLVTEQEAQKIKTQIITNWDRKPIFWIFAGSFLKLRGKSDLTGKVLLNLLGSELNSRLEFSGWKISSWTQDKIYAAASHHIEESFGNHFDDASIAMVCSKALEAEGGFREFEKHARALYRLAQKDNSAAPQVNIEMTKRYYAKLEGGEGAA